MNATTSNSQMTTQEARSGTEKTIDHSFFWTTRILALAVAGVLLWIAGQVAWNSIPAIQQFGLEFLATAAWNPVEELYGVLPMAYGTVVSSFIALLLAVPVGLACAIVLSENFLPLSIRTPLTFLVELLAAIPSVVYGLWGIYVLIPFLQPIGRWFHDNFSYIPLFATQYAGPGMLPAGVVLAIMILPIVAAISRDSLAAVPSELRWGAYGIGSTRWQTIFSVLIPAAFSGIVGGIMLALGRALGETIAVTLVIGNSNNLNFSILAPANTIASLLANQFAEASGLQKSSLFYAGLVLFVITLIVNILAYWIIQKVKKY
ncbi:MAG: Phosphate transport system permease protein PstC [Chroococcidiopsis sp. SAG 2025]|uniref:phosphate ABC transporter permease subunit PstC n=1 Tax=Chroococcidiopsis sp. SAG 2025 TaxID=171389 RepID=UPI0029375A01|nr:Phosphate transport system permease protein PstC [Chroococcidiopsis sp. SAG 2025]